MGPPLVSFDAESGPGLGLKIGDTITVNVLGRNVRPRSPISGRLTGSRSPINFLVVFSPNTLPAAPHRVPSRSTIPPTDRRANKAPPGAGRPISAVTTIKVEESSRPPGLLEKISRRSA